MIFLGSERREKGMVNEGSPGQQILTPVFPMNCLLTLLQHSHHWSPHRSLDLVAAPPFLVVAGNASSLGILSPPPASSCRACSAPSTSPISQGPGQPYSPLNSRQPRGPQCGHLDPVLQLFEAYVRWQLSYLSCWSTCQSSLRGPWWSVMRLEV